MVHRDSKKRQQGGILVSHPIPKEHAVRLQIRDLKQIILLLHLEWSRGARHEDQLKMCHYLLTGDILDEEKPEALGLTFAVQVFAPHSKSCTFS